MKIYKLKNSPYEGDTKTDADGQSLFIGGKWREIYCKDDEDFYECWKEYDENGHIVHFLDSDDYECWFNEYGTKITKEEFKRLYVEKK